MEPLCDLVCCEFVVIFDYFSAIIAAKNELLDKKNSGHTCADGNAVGTDPLM